MLVEAAILVSPLNSYREVIIQAIEFMQAAKVELYHIGCDTYEDLVFLLAKAKQNVRRLCNKKILVSSRNWCAKKKKFFTCDTQDVAVEKTFHAVRKHICLCHRQQEKLSSTLVAPKIWCNHCRAGAK